MIKNKGEDRSKRKAAADIIAEAAFLRKIAFISAVVMAVVIFLFFFENRYVNISLNEGDVLKEDVYAQTSFYWVDKVTSESRLQERIDSAPKIYLLDDEVGKVQKKSFLGDMTRVRKAMSSGMSPQERLDFVRTVWGEGDNTFFNRISAERLETLTLVCVDVLDNIYRNGILDDTFFLDSNSIGVEIRRKSDNILMDRESLILRKDAEKYLRTLIRKYLSGDEAYIEFTEYVLKNYLFENVFFSEELTKKNIEQIRVNFLPVQTKVSEGDIIARKGQIADRTIYEKMETMGEILRSQSTHRIIAFSLSFCALFVVFLFFLLKNMFGNRKRNIYFFVMNSLLYVITLAVFRIFTEFSFYFFPFLAFVIMTYFLADYHTAIISLLFNVSLGFVFFDDYGHLFLWILTALMFIHDSDRFRTRIPKIDYLLKYLMFTYVMVVLSRLSEHSDELFSIFTGSLLQASAYVGGSFALGYTAVYVQEKIQNITTEVSLTGLLDWNNPMLKELMALAPGTYRHSLIVSELAAEAAKDIGADPLLSRVGGLYHDIGKVKRPDYFIENQMFGPNRHDSLLPMMSVRILKNHVSEGADMARKGGLGIRLRDIIQEHHGTSLIKFFYLKHKADDKNRELDEKYFRYDGPRPSSRESAIIFLADKAEAVSRLLLNAPFHHVQERIAQIFREALLDGQLDESHLTFDELNRVQDSFINYFKGSRHKRIEYPKERKAKE